MNTRYIEINSGYRDRNLYPSVGEFIVPISGSNGCSGLPVVSAVDPVVNAAPVYVFVKGFFNQEGQGNGSSGILSTMELDVSIPQPYDPTNPKGNSQWYSYIVPDVYNGYFLFDKYSFSGSSDLSNNGTTRRIVASSGYSTCEVTFDIPQPALTFASDNYYTIADMSGINTSTGSNFPNYPFEYDATKTWCIQSLDIFGTKAPKLSNDFIDYTLKIEPDPASTYFPCKESRKIVSYDPAQHLVTIDSAFTENFPFSDVNLNNIVSIRSGKSSETFEDRGVVLQAYLTTGSPAIVSGSNILTTVGATPLASGGANYKGNYIFIIPRYTDPVLQFNYPRINIDDPDPKRDLFMYRIIGYTADNTFVLDRPIDLGNYEGGTLDNRYIEILHVIKDNYSPLVYSGSIVSQNEVVCYEISLVTLTLPNVDLTSGSRVSFYPYVYVLLENAANPMGTMKNIFYSNNPPSGRALFVAPITDVSDPLFTPYVRIDGFGITQTVKFKPNDALRFRVFMPDGSPFQPIIGDTLPPLPPSRSQQIEATFSIRRI